MCETGSAAILDNEFALIAPADMLKEELLVVSAARKMGWQTTGISPHPIA